jgi:hypothetical protein
MELHKEDVNVRTFVHDCASIFKGVARGKNIELQVPHIVYCLDQFHYMKHPKFKMLLLVVLYF